MPESGGSDYINSTMGKVSNEYLASYPHFLKPNKHYPHRRTDDTHIKNAMELALERYENQLVDEEKNRIKHL